MPVGEGLAPPVSCCHFEPVITPVRNLVDIQMLSRQLENYTGSLSALGMTRISKAVSFITFSEKSIFQINPYLSYGESNLLT